MHENSLINLMRINKKSELLKASKEIIVTQKDLVNVIMSVKIGIIPEMNHYPIFREIIPESVRLKDNDLRTLSQNGVGRLNPEAIKVFNKINTIFEQRKQLAGHMFWMGDTPYWWFIYFSLKELNPRNNHWEGGSHLHLVSWITHPKQNPVYLMEEYVKAPKPRIGGGIHIKSDFRNEA